MATATQKKRDKKKKKQKKDRVTARTADRHVLYQEAVQDPEAEVEFLMNAYRRLNRKEPKHLREDFCGTALLAGVWVEQGPEFTAEGYDLDAETLEWGKVNNLDLLEGGDRVELHLADAREAGKRKVDVRCAQNFSWQVFHQRKDLLAYFKGVRQSMAKDGIFVIDIYGGTDATEETEEERSIGKGIDYVWEQRAYHPVTGEHECAIHFRFSDGSAMRNAFEYHWRHYSMAEVRDLLDEVGFHRIECWFEQFDDDGDGTGVFAMEEKGPRCEGWLAYIVCQG